MGDKIGRVHVGKLDLSQLQTRKMKGLKRTREEGDADTMVDDDSGSEMDEDLAPDSHPKRERV